MSNNKRAAAPEENASQKKQKNDQSLSVLKSLNMCREIVAVCEKEIARIASFDLVSYLETVKELQNAIGGLQKAVESKLPNFFAMLPEGPKHEIFDLVIAGRKYGRELSGVCKEWRQYFFNNEEKRLKSYLTKSTTWYENGILRVQTWQDTKEIFIIFLIWMLEKGIIRAFRIHFLDNLCLDYEFGLHVWFAEEHTYQGEICDADDTTNDTVLKLMEFGACVGDSTDMTPEDLFVMLRRYSHALSFSTETQFEIDIIEKSLEPNRLLLETIIGGKFDYDPQYSNGLDMKRLESGLPVYDPIVFMPEMNKILNLY